MKKKEAFINKVPQEKKGYTLGSDYFDVAKGEI